MEEVTAMTGSLGSASSIPGEGTPQTPMMEAARGGEPEPNDWEHIHNWVSCRAPAGCTGSWVCCCGCGYQQKVPDSTHEDQTPDRGGDARSTSSDRSSVPGRHLVLDRSEFGPSNVQLALAHAHVAFAKRHAPHLLEEWLRYEAP